MTLDSILLALRSLINEDEKVGLMEDGPVLHSDLDITFKLIDCETTFKFDWISNDYETNDYVLEIYYKDRNIFGVSSLWVPELGCFIVHPEYNDDNSFTFYEYDTYFINKLYNCDKEDIFDIINGCNVLNNLQINYIENFSSEFYPEKYVHKNLTKRK